MKSEKMEIIVDMIWHISWMALIGVVLLVFFGLGLSLLKAAAEPVSTLIAFSVICMVALLIYAKQLFSEIALQIGLWRGWLCITGKHEPYQTNHGATPLEVIKGLHNEPFEYMATFRGREKLAESTIYSRRQVRHSEVMVRDYTGTISIHNHPGKDAGPFSAQDIVATLSSKQAAAIVVARGYVYQMTLRPEHWKLDFRAIAREVDNAYNDAQDRCRGADRVLALQILRLEEICKKYDIGFEYWPYDLFVTMEEERSNVAMPEPKTLVCVNNNVIK